MAIYTYGTIMPSVEEMNIEIPDTIISGRWEEMLLMFVLRLSNILSSSSGHVVGLLFYTYWG